MSEGIRTNALRRGITRLCHFTPSRNLVHIATDPYGVLATVHLTSDEKAVFSPTDRKRFDGHEDHICCSIQYPNAWYLSKARKKDRLFSDWVVLFIGPHCLWMPDTKFCARNAAAGRGAGVREGEDAFDSLFAPSVPGAHQRTFKREPRRPAFLTTDEQAEVLIPDRVARQDILGVAVADEAQAKREIARLRMLNERVPPITIARDFFYPHRQSTAFKSGELPKEHIYYGGDDNG